MKTCELWTLNTCDAEQFRKVTTSDVNCAFVDSTTSCVFQMLCLCVVVLVPSASLAVDPVLHTVSTTRQAAAHSDAGIRNGNLIVAPIPFSNDTIGSGLTLGAGYLFKNEGSRPSAVGLAYVRTSNGTSILGAAGNVVFENNRWSLGLGAVDGNINYDLPILGGAEVPLSQSVTGGGARLEYGFNDEFQVGFSLGYGQSKITIDSDTINNLPANLQPDLDIDLARLTIDVRYDNRNDTFYPTDGYFTSFDLSYAEVEDDLFDGKIGLSDRNYLKGIAKANIYKGLTSTGVLAGSAVLCGTQREAPFFDSCGVGFVDGLRGFSSLGALEEWSLSAQIEFRQRLGKRIGVVAFAGAGAGGDGLDSLSFDNGGAALGAGVRYRLSKKFGLDYSVDYAVNDQGEGFLYLYLGNRF